MTGSPNAAILAACPHYGTCGGCTDISDKRDLLPAALTSAGYNVGEVPLHVSPPFSRRRMDLAACRAATGVQIGLHRHRSHETVDLQTCHVLHPRLFALVAPLREELGRLDLARGVISVVANLAEQGPDVLLRSEAAPSSADHRRLAAFAERHRVPRITHQMTGGPALPIALMETPTVRCGTTDVRLPPGAFLQATEDGERMIVQAVLAGLPRLRGRARIAELYAGIGTLTFPLAERARVSAYEGDRPAWAALDEAARHGVPGRIVAEQRDLVRRPLAGAELTGVAALVLDPPPAGAPVQMLPAVAARVPRVVYVSCNPQTLARDAARLRTAGYELMAATSIDQFIGTPLVEAVCVFGLG